MKASMTEPVGQSLRRQMARMQPPPDVECPKCGKLESAGYVATFHKCEVCVKADAEAEAVAEQRAVMWVNALLPPSAKGLGFDDMDPKRTDPKAIGECRYWEYGPTGLYLVGRAGTGKTRLAMAMAAREIIQNQRQVLFLDLPRLFQDLKESFVTEAKEPRRKLRAARTVPFLVLDDIGVGHGREFGENELLPVINARMEATLPTIYTSNLSWSGKNRVPGFETLEDKLGARVAQRIIHSSKAVRVTGQSNWLVRG